MDKLKATLGRKIGPFSVGVWIIVVIAGVGLGLLIKRRMGGTPEGDFSGTAEPSNDPGLDGLPATQGAPTVVQQDFETVTRLREEQDRFRDEVDERFQDVQDVVGEGDEGIREQLEDFFTRINKRIDEVTKQPAEKPSIPKQPSKPVPLPRVKPKKPTPPKKPAKDKKKDKKDVRQTRTYTVRRGDTLRKIAAKTLGDPARNVEIRQLNTPRSGNWDLIYPGEKFKIPAK